MIRSLSPDRLAMARRPGGDLLDRPRENRDRPARNVSRSPSTPPTRVWPRRRSGTSCRIAAATSGWRPPGASAATTASPSRRSRFPNGLPSPNVRLTLEDEHGTLWIGTNGGIASYDGRSVVSYAGTGGCPRRNDLVRRGRPPRRGLVRQRPRSGLLERRGVPHLPARRRPGRRLRLLAAAGERRFPLAGVARPRRHALHPRTRPAGSETAASSPRPTV